MRRLESAMVSSSSSSFHVPMDVRERGLDLQVCTVSLDDFFRLLVLQKSFMVLFYPRWLRHSHSLLLQDLFRNVNTQLKTLTLVQLLVEGMDEVETFVVDHLCVKTLPYVAVYDRGNRVFGAEIVSNTIIDFDLAPLLHFVKPLQHYHVVESNVYSSLFPAPGGEQCSLDQPMLVFVAGERSSVGKSSVCLAILSALIAEGVDPNVLAYIKPVTQCEEEQPVTKFCEAVGIACRGIGPVVFYKGFTRAYLFGETETSEELLAQASRAVEQLGRGKRFVLIDGVGYPSVGSICNISNGHVAQALRSPVLLVGKSGVGDAVDSFNLNATFFESFGVQVLGGVFNQIDKTGYYSVENCKEAVTMYFQQFKPHQMPYGFIPKLDKTEMQAGSEEVMDVEEAQSNSEKKVEKSAWTTCFMDHVQVQRLVHDIFISNLLKNAQSIPITSSGFDFNLLGACRVSFDENNMSSSSALTSPVHSSPLRSAKKRSSIVTTSIPEPHLTNVKAAVGVKRSRLEVEEEARNKGANGG